MKNRLSLVILLLIAISFTVVNTSFATKPSYWNSKDEFVEYPPEGGVIIHPAGEIPRPTPVVTEEPILFVDCIKDEEIPSQCKTYDYNALIKREFKILTSKPTFKPIKYSPKLKVTPKPTLKPTPKPTKKPVVKSNVKSIKKLNVKKNNKKIKITKASNKKVVLKKSNKKQVNKK